MLKNGKLIIQIRTGNEGIINATVRYNSVFGSTDIIYELDPNFGSFLTEDTDRNFKIKEKIDQLMLSINEPVKNYFRDIKWGFRYPPLIHKTRMKFSELIKRGINEFDGTHKHSVHFHFEGGSEFNHSLTIKFGLWICPECSGFYYPERKRFDFWKLRDGQICPKCEIPDLRDWFFDEEGDVPKPTWLSNSRPKCDLDEAVDTGGFFDRVKRKLGV
jgi:hypothetical protein